MDARRREKKSIQRRECFVVLLVLASFCGFGGLVVALEPIGIPYILLVLLLVIPYGCLICIPGYIIMNPYMEKTLQRRKKWFKAYGIHILASVSWRRQKGARVIDARDFKRYGRDLFNRVYLNWQAPETGKRYAICVSGRSHSYLWNLPEGALWPVYVDPNDPHFFDIPQKFR